MCSLFRSLQSNKSSGAFSKATRILIALGSSGKELFDRPRPCTFTVIKVHADFEVAVAAGPARLDDHTSASALLVPHAVDDKKKHRGRVRNREPPWSWGDERTQHNNATPHTQTKQTITPFILC